MGDTVSSKPQLIAAELRPWPAWAPLREAAQYARMTPDKLLALVRQKEICGYPNPHFRRGPKGEGEWWVNLPSVDEYHDRQSGRGAVMQAVLATRAKAGL